MKTIVVTNNPLVMGKCGYEILFVDTNAEGLLIKVRDMVYEGYTLISHPLPASIRMIYSPYRSVALGEKVSKPDEFHAEVAENSLRDYRRLAGYRKPDEVNKESYKWMDSQLLSVALREPRPF